MRAYIYHSDDSLLKAVSIDGRSKRHKKFMSEDTITLYFPSLTKVAFQLGDYITHKGEKFYLNTLPEIAKKASNSFEYTCIFESTLYDLGKVQFLLFTDDPVNPVPMGTFNLEGKAQRFADQLLVNLNRVFSGWTLAASLPDTNIRNLYFEGENCLEAINKICHEFDLVFSIKGKEITIAKSISGSAGNFEYGKGKGLYQLNRQKVNSLEVVTRLFAYGSEKNIPANYRNYSSRLKMPVNYIEKNVGSYGIVEHSKIFDDIFPHRTGTITWVDSENILRFRDSSMPFDLNGEEPNRMAVVYETTQQAAGRFATAQGDQTSNVIRVNENNTLIAGDIIKGATIQSTYHGSGYWDLTLNFSIHVSNNEFLIGYIITPSEQIKVNPGCTVRVGDSIGNVVIEEITDNNTYLTLTLSDEIQVYKDDILTVEGSGYNYLFSGVAAKISFTSGDLTGYTFEITSYDHVNKEFVIKVNSDEKDFDIPSAVWKPAVGDTYVLLDIRMPQSYIDEAEQELLDAANDYLNKYSIPQVAYKLTLDPIYLANNPTTFTPGQNLHITDDDLDLDADIQINGVSYPITDERKVEVDIYDEGTPLNIELIDSNFKTSRTLGFTQKTNFNAHEVAIRKLQQESSPIEHTHAWSEITGKPTTISGFGITDAYTKTEADARYKAIGYTPAWSEITGKPTTISGFGITDAYTKTEADARYKAIGYTPAWSEITGKPTTISGFGITDAYTKTEADARYYVGTSSTIRALLSSTATGLTYTSSTGVFSLTSGYAIPATTDIANWNTAYGWGNHASAGYYVGSSSTIRALLSSTATGLTYTSSTGVFSLTSGYAIPATTDITNWNTAYGWGNHASAGYYKNSYIQAATIPSSPVTDLNTDYANGGLFGTYGSTSYWTNTPVSMYGMILAMRQEDNNKVQLAFDIRHGSSDYGDMYIRTRNTSGWSGWGKVYHSLNSNLSTVDWAANNLAIAGKIGIGITPTVMLDAVGSYGRVLFSSMSTDATAKYNRIGVRHYTNSEEPFYGIMMLTENSSNQLYLGGGTSVGNAATAIISHVADNSTTTTGYEALRLFSTSLKPTLRVRSTAAYNASPTVTFDSYLIYNSSSYFTNFGKIVIGKENTTDGNSAGYMAFYKKANGSAAAEAMRINSSGYLGINTNTPAYMLDVNGSGNFSGKLKTAVSTTASAGFNIGIGQYPTSPIDGDVWTDGQDLLIQLDGVTYTITLNQSLSNYLLKSGGTMTGKLTSFTSTTSYAAINIPHGVAPTSPSNGDIWTTTSGLFARINGTTVAYGSGATINDNIFKWDTTNNYYKPYTLASDVGANGYFYLENATPTTYSNILLNYNGSLGAYINYGAAVRGIVGTGSTGNIGIYGKALSSGNWAVYSEGISASLYAYASTGTPIIAESSSGSLLLQLKLAGTEKLAIRDDGGIKQASGAYNGFFGVTPVARPTALTTALTTVTFTAPATPDYAWGAGTNSSAWGWATNDEFKTAASVIANLQTRVNELETKLKALGLLT